MADVEPDTCQAPKWCQERRGHRGPHKRYLNELVCGHGTLALTLETRGKCRVPIVSLGNGTVAALALSWGQLDQLANALRLAHRSYA